MAPYTLLYNKDPPIPIYKLIKVVELYMGENTLGKRIEVKCFHFNSCKMLETMRANQKRYYQNRRSIHMFQDGDLVLLKKHNVDTMELKWEPDYRIVKLPSA